jgi:hypothetical protein
MNMTAAHAAKRTLIVHRNAPAKKKVGVRSLLADSTSAAQFRRRLRHVPLAARGLTRYPLVQPTTQALLSEGLVAGSTSAILIISEMTDPGTCETSRRDPATSAYEVEAVVLGEIVRGPTLTHLRVRQESWQRIGGASPSRGKA